MGSGWLGARCGLEGDGGNSNGLLGHEFRVVVGMLRLHGVCSIVVWARGGRGHVRGHGHVRRRAGLTAANKSLSAS